MLRWLIINADDFGLCEGVNRAVARAHSEGVLTSATLMANMPAAVGAVAVAKKLPTLGLGVHLNCITGRPISNASCVGCLVDGDGDFVFSAVELSLLSVIRPRIRSAIASEFSAQIQWVLDHGLVPTHLDSHKHIHSFPVIFSIVCQLARQFKIPAVRWCFEPREVTRMPWPLPSSGGRGRSRTVRFLARVNRIQNRDFFKTDAFLGIAHTGKVDVNFFKAVALYNSSAIAEVMTHPGFADGLDPKMTILMQQRQADFDALCSDRTKAYLKDSQIKLVHYGQI